MLYESGTFSTKMRRLKTSFLELLDSVFVFEAFPNPGSGVPYFSEFKCDVLFFAGLHFLV